MKDIRFKDLSYLNIVSLEDLFGLAQAERGTSNNR